MKNRYEMTLDKRKMTCAVQNVTYVVKLIKQKCESGEPRHVMLCSGSWES